MELDFRKVGLKCGLELHQQLDTGKLFCRTPSILREDAPHYTIKRKLRPVVSELGEFDKAALEAFQKGLSYVYEGYHDTVSLVELDEEPPQKIDPQAFKTVLQIAMMLNSNVIDEIYTMRKMVIDGSNTSGFQRTALVATGGEVKLQNKRLGIQTIVIEEDSARPSKKTDTEIYYRLDRLGIPLIELATAPGIETPEEAKEAALAIGKIFRLTGKVKRGLGTIRQDLNISIRDGARVEIKGVQELEIIDEYVRREVQRQHNLVEIKNELRKKGVKAENLKYVAKEVTKHLLKSESKIIKGALSKNEIILGIKLHKFSGLLGKELQPSRRLGTEFADHVKTKTGLRGLFHSDELPNYGITTQEKEAVAKELGCAMNDAFVILAGPHEKAMMAINAVSERAIQCLEGVPEETRGAIEGGNTEYLRPLPGAARMYPETDLESIVVSEQMLKEVQKTLPKSEEEREKLYQKLGLNEKYVQEMKLSNYAPFFEGLVQKGFEPKRAAIFLLENLVEAKRDGAKPDNLSEQDLEEILTGIKEGKVTKEIQKEIIIQKSQNPSLGIDSLLAKSGITSADKGEAQKIIRQIVAKNMAIIKSHGVRAVGPLMGDAMKALKGKAAGKDISSMLSTEIKKAMGRPKDV